MEQELLKVLIVDDEPIARKGLHYIIDWGKLGFYICAEAEDGEEALAKIKKYNPDLVLLDIRMPRMYGTELLRQARECAFTGDFIILSGYSDFQYAQTVLQYGASFYLSKPVEEEELENAALTIKSRILEKQNNQKSLHQYRKKAKSMVLLDLFLGNETDSTVNYAELGLYAPIYQVVIYGDYTPFQSPYSFSDLFHIANRNPDSFEQIMVEGRNVLLLKGDFAIDSFAACLQHYEDGPEKGSPLDSFFIAYSATVPRITDIRFAYQECVTLMKRRFFCEEHQHVISRDCMPSSSVKPTVLDAQFAKKYSETFVNSLKSCNHRMIDRTLDELKTDLFHCAAETLSIKHILADIFLQIKQDILYTYRALNIPLPYNAAIIELFENKACLYEILRYFSEQFDMIMRAIGSNTGTGVLDDVLDYIHHNYASPLRLETMAPLFGYSSSYLGKLLTRKTGKNFNAYLDQVRIQQAACLLRNTDRKVYEIASQVGYRKTDCFYQKFKKIMQTSPKEYRQKYRQ